MSNQSNKQTKKEKNYSKESPEGRKTILYFNETIISPIAIFSTEIMQPKGQLHDIFKMPKI